jgi:hypothetical protein
MIPNGCKLCYIYRNPKELEDREKYLIHQLFWLNQCAGLDEEKSAGLDVIDETATVGSNPLTTAEANVYLEHPAVTPAPDEAKAEIFQVEAAHPMATVTESAAQPTAPLESPGEGERSGEPRGVWGGFWRRPTDG